MKRKVILGISGGERNSCAAIAIDGRIIAAAEEERFNRTKFYTGFPDKAVNFCTGQADVSIEDITDIAVGYFMSEYHNDRGGSVTDEGNPFIEGLSHSYDIPHRVAEACGAMGSYGVERNRINLHRIPHHLAHAAAAFYLHNIKEAAYLSVDYMAEMDAIAAGRICHGDYVQYFSLKLTDSIAALYAAVTEYLGFRGLSDEYKVMGLASYGSPIYIEEMRKLVELRRDGTISLNTDYFSIDFIFGAAPHVTEKFVTLFGPARSFGAKPDRKAADIAASLQLILREAVLHLARRLRDRSGLDTLCYTGEFALNCDVNTALAEAKLFKHIYIHPASHDAGTAIGAALYVDGMARQGRTFHHDDFSVYLGPGYSDKDVKGILEDSAMSYIRLEDEDLISVCADDLRRGKIVGWFQGRMEMGPRALGNRSILADPRSRKMVDIINKKIKLREQFRPFAPSVLEEDARDCFEFPEGADMSYMLFLARAKKMTMKKGPAIVHIDGTSRPQTVSYEQNPLYWKLISKFKKLTGVPFILNTSFNINGEPIVCTPLEALKCFSDTNMDVLYIGNYRMLRSRKFKRVRQAGDIRVTKYAKKGDADQSV